MEEFDAQEILPGLWLGSEKAGENLEAMQSRGIKRVFVPARTGCPVALFPDHITYRCYAVADLADFPDRRTAGRVFFFCRSRADSGPLRARKKPQRCIRHCVRHESQALLLFRCRIFRAQEATADINQVRSAIAGVREES